MSPYDWSYMQKPKKQTLTQRVSRLQKEIEELREGYVLHMRKYHPISEPYTAMKSTGKTAIEVVEAIKRVNKYCECAKPMICSALINGSKCGICHYCNKSIKPQEDKMSQIIRILFFSKGWDGTKAEAYDIADRILAIVKGE